MGPVLGWTDQPAHAYRFSSLAEEGVSRMLRLFIAALFWPASPALAQDGTAFRVGTVTYASEGVTSSVGTFAVYSGDLALVTINMPGGKPLFNASSPLSPAKFWGSSSRRPLTGTYQAVLGDDTVLEASLNPDVLLSPVENLSAVYRDGTLDVAWTPLAEAQTYEVVLHEEGGAGDILARRQVRRGPVSFPAALEPGEYLIVIRALNYRTDVLPLPPTDLAMSDTLHPLSVP